MGRILGGGVTCVCHCDHVHFRLPVLLRPNSQRGILATQGRSYELSTGLKSSAESAVGALDRE